MAITMSMAMSMSKGGPTGDLPGAVRFVNPETQQEVLFTEAGIYLYNSNRGEIGPSRF
jgi:hypothetical protein